MTIISMAQVHGASYKVDVKGAHAFVQFKIKHLGYSWLLGEFNSFDGDFIWDEKKPLDSNIKMTIDTTSLDSNHAERDKHLKGKDFLNVKKFPSASFQSTEFTPSDNADNYNLTGDLTLKGITRSITFEVEKIGEGRDPWGGYRVGFEGEVKLKLSDYGINYNLGPASEWVNMGLYIEGIKQ
jgi:polyisoprenoid-binding protein YceI